MHGAAPLPVAPEGGGRSPEGSLLVGHQPDIYEETEGRPPLTSPQTAVNQRHATVGLTYCYCITCTQRETHSPSSTIPTPHDLHLQKGKVSY